MNINRTICLIILLIAVSFYTYGRQEDSQLYIKTKNVNGKTAEHIFNILSESYGLKVSYQNGDSTFMQPVYFDNNKTITIDELLQILEKNLPYKVIHNKGYIIFQKKPLEKKYKLDGRLHDRNSNAELKSASVYIKQTGKGILSDESGFFSFELSPGSYDVVVKFMGYNDRLVHVNLYGNQEFDVRMDENIYNINEVNVTSERSFVSNFETGRTIAKMESKELSSVTTGNVSDAIHARVPGVWATKVSGAPGDHMKIRIRGINSLHASVDPLYIVDGVPIPKVNFNSLGISDLNSSDIKSMIILKDAASSAIYGFQGGNGVVIIETKDAGGKPYITFQQKTGIQYFNKRYDLNNTFNTLQTFELADVNLGTSYFPSDIWESPSFPYYKFSLNSDDWQKQMFQRGVITEYQLNTGGDIKGLKYYLSGAHYDNSGIIKNSEYTKNNILANLKYDIKDKIKLNVNYRGAIEQNSNNLDTYMGNPLIFQGLNTVPFYNSQPLYMQSMSVDKKLIYKQNGVYLPGGMLSLLNDYNREQVIRTNSIFASGSYKIVKNLYLNTSASLSRKDYKYTYDYREQERTPEELNFQQPAPEYTGVYGNLFSTDQVNVINYNADIVYNYNISNHFIKLQVGYRNYSDNVYWRIDSSSYSTYELQNKPDIFPRGSMIIYNDNGSISRIIKSGYFHANYNYINKYTVSLAGNYSTLSEGNGRTATGFFPSVAVNWDIAREFLIADLNKLDFFNLYVNWGKVGNYPLNGLSGDLYSTRSFSTGSANVNQSYLSNLGNHYFKQEEMIEVNIGTKVSVFSERFQVGVDYYKKRNSNLMLLRNIPLYYGGGKMMINSGEMHSSGFEASVEAYPIRTDKFSWFIRANYSKNNQYVSKLDTTLLFYDEADYIPDFIISQDKPMGSIMGYEFLGFYNPTNITQAGLINSGRAYLEKGVLYSRSDTSIATLAGSEKRIIGNSLPDFTFNILSSFQYKNFQLDMHWYGVMGIDKYNSTLASTYMSGLNPNVHNHLLNGGNTDNDYYRSSAFYNSSFFVEDASFVRLKRISLSWFPEKKWFKYVKPEFTLTLENMVTLTKYSGYDPEATIYTDNNFSDNALDKGAYPLPKTVHFAVKLTLQ